MPTPYRTPLLERVKDWDDIDLKVFYCIKSITQRSWKVEVTDWEQYTRVIPGHNFVIPLINKNITINFRIWGELSKGDFDAVIIGGYYPPTMYLSALWSIYHRIPYIINSESQSLNKKHVMKSFIKKLLIFPIIKSASAYLPTGKFAEKYFIHYGADPGKIFYFPNSPDVDFFIRESNRWRKNK